jgi:hypothetical protein
MTRFGISRLVSDIGESLVISGVAKTFNARGDPTESYTTYAVNGIVQVMDGSEEEVKEGLLNKEDVILFVDETEPNLSIALANDNYVTVSSTVSGIYQITSVVTNLGHYEVYAKRMMPT